MSCCMHDIMDLEGRGVPSVAVATDEFVEAAAAQADALGFEPALVFVPHPIQDRTVDEIKALARNAVEAILGRLRAP